MAPDGQGNGIPLDATWTKINRSLVSAELLERKGVRYEARPEFVAVLGVLSKATIVEWARLSAEIRSSRKVPPEIDAAKAVGNDGAGHGKSTVEEKADKARVNESKDQREEKEEDPWDSDLGIWDSDLEAWDLAGGSGNSSEAGAADLDSDGDGDDDDDTRPGDRAQPAHVVRGRRTSHSDKDGDRDRDPHRGLEVWTPPTSPSRQINTNAAPLATSATGTATTSTPIAATSGNDSFSSSFQKLRLDQKKMALLNTLGAVGLSTAAASLMELLVEAGPEDRLEGTPPS